MRKQLTFLELIRLLLAFLFAGVIFLFASIFSETWLGETGGLFGTLLYLLSTLTIPAFLTVFISTFIPSWRYKLVAATLTLVGITLWGLLDLVVALNDFWALVGVLVRLSALMTGALLAVLIWKNWKARRATRVQTVRAPMVAATKEPKTSPVVLGLSLISVPLTYITIFSSAFLVLGYSAILFFALSAMPRVPVALIIAAILAPLVAAWASLRALWAQFFAKPPFQPAQSIDLAARPLLRNMLTDVCNAVGTRVPDNVLLHLEPTFFVTQQKIRTFDRVVKGRTLAIGMPLLPLLSREELKAVLAHEFAHFSGQDTLYSVWVAPVYRSLGDSIMRLQANTSSAQSGTQVVMNLLLVPSLTFLIVFYEFFASIEAIISRSRELRADWIAARHFGSEALVSALKKIVQYNQYFSDQQAQMEPADEHQVDRPYRILGSVDEALLQDYLEAAMAAEEGEFDSHPTLRTRIGNLPESASGSSDSTDDIQQELKDDDAALSAAYAEIVQQLRALYAQQQPSGV